MERKLDKTLVLISHGTPAFMLSMFLLATNLGGCSRSFSTLVYEGDTKAVESRLSSKSEGIDLNQALQIAARQGHRDIAALLLDGGAEVDKQEEVIRIVEPPMAVAEGVWEYRIEAAAAGQTPLMAAVDRGHSEVITLLIALGANPHLQCVYEEVRFGMGGMVSSWRQGRAVSVRLNFEGSGPVQVKIDRDGRVRSNFVPKDEVLLTPVQLAEKNNQQEIVQLLTGP